MENKEIEVNKAANKAQIQWVRTLKKLDKLVAEKIIVNLTVKGNTDTHNWEIIMHNHEHAANQFRITFYARSKYSSIASVRIYKWNEKPTPGDIREQFRAASRMN